MFITSLSVFGQSAKISPKDISVLVGERWTGTLTYRDYGTGKPVTILSDVTISLAKGEKSKWNFSFEYPKEPKANSSDVIELSRDGRTFDGEKVIEIKNLSSGVLRFTTEIKGEDDDKPALIRHVYLISKTEFTKTKEVKFDGAAEFIERNTYKWKR